MKRSRTSPYAVEMKAASMMLRAGEAVLGANVMRICGALGIAVGSLLAKAPEMAQRARDAFEAGRARAIDDVLTEKL